MQSLDYMPLVKKHLTDKGTFYKRHYCTTAICCPSRVSLWTGKLAHNTNVTDVNPPHGGYPKFVKQGLNDAYLPLWLQQAGYDTYYTGKLFNAHTVDNYHTPYAAGWNGSDFLLDPYTYMYLNATFQRNRNPPISYPNQHSVDVLTQKALSFLDDATTPPNRNRPFFLGIAPVAPHSNVHISKDALTRPLPSNPNDSIDDLISFTPPIPAARHAHLFANVTVPRTPHFNPAGSASGASWVRGLRHQGKENVEFNDHYYRQRLRTLQSVDELVEQVVERLERLGVLEETFVFYTTDNGFHIGQHRLQPGKECGFEEDINIPLIVRGPGVPRGEVAEVVTAHVDLAPTVLGIAGVDVEGVVKGGVVPEFDGEGIPLTKGELKAAVGTRHEHVTVEFWGIAASEGKFKLAGDDGQRLVVNNTYKALRVIGEEYNLYYSVWCSNEHELYDLKTDPYQLNNLLHSTAKRPATLIGVPFEKVIARLDALLFVLKSCKGQTCVRPWHALHPAGNVQNLHGALSSRFDVFYEEQQQKVSFNRCEMGYLLDAEGPQFETDGLAYRQGVRWSEWV
ncbi:alkaline-phosphatase-like protein [Chaetomium fimeti]|uniref:Arylsulfatase n=1 Tax=Chaetomium fimeti TaxID=1854472 RepID=A0AAE0H8F4_9PEZI|nr:alkaline-phosphatase-like protein [Chaetomium fimeti]